MGLIEQILLLRTNNYGPKIFRYFVFATNIKEEFKQPITPLFVRNILVTAHWVFYSLF